MTQDLIYEERESSRKDANTTDGIERIKKGNAVIASADTKSELECLGGQWNDGTASQKVVPAQPASHQR